MSKAKQFLEAAETVEALADDSNDVADAYVTLCVHAGIAAADVICCKRLGEHSRGEDHTAAVALARGGLQRWLVWPVVRGPVGRLRVVRGGPPRPDRVSSEAGPWCYVAPLAGIEPATHGLGNRCSIH